MGRPTIPESTIREILTSDDSLSVLAKQVGCHRSLISLIRRGRIYKKVAPELPRWSADHTCPRCLHWQNGRCGLDFPDPLTEGIAFARECNSFTHHKAHA
jgi:hypothetical protein